MNADGLDGADGYPAWAGIDPSGTPAAGGYSRLPRVGGDRPRPPLSDIQPPRVTPRGRG